MGLNCVCPLIDFFNKNTVSQVLFSFQLNAFTSLEMRLIYFYKLHLEKYMKKILDLFCFVLFFAKVLTIINS